MSKKRNIKVQPVTLYEKEHQLQMLGQQLVEIITEVANLENSLRSIFGHLRHLKKEITILGRIIEGLQQKEQA